MHRKMSGAQKNCLHFITRTKSPQDSTIGCTFFLGGGRLDYIGKALKIKIKFNYKLYFYSNTFNSCIQKTKYNPWLNLSAVFRYAQKNARSAKKLSAFRHPHKMGCVFNHGLYLSCNTTCG